MSGNEMPPVPRIVLDTNVCLDLFLFAEPQAAGLHQAIQRGAIEAVTREDCRAEWLRVLHYPQLPIDDALRPGLVAAFDAAIRCLPAARATADAAVALPRCADPDDQKFLELAQAAGARWLVSKDNELLKLAARCARADLFWIGLPQMWSLQRDHRGASWR
jgi:putative PIN family toxin of toxin-antitoxin system